MRSRAKAGPSGAIGVSEHNELKFNNPPMVVDAELPTKPRSIASSKRRMDYPPRADFYFQKQLRPSGALVVQILSIVTYASRIDCVCRTQQQSARSGIVRKYVLAIHRGSAHTCLRIASLRHLDASSRCVTRRAFEPRLGARRASRRDRNSFLAKYCATAMGGVCGAPPRRSA